MRHELDQWDKLLVLGKFTYNFSVHTAMGKTPFELDLGYTPRMPIDIPLRTAG